MNDAQRSALRSLPVVDDALNQPVLEPYAKRFRRRFLKRFIQEEIERARQRILNSPDNPPTLSAEEAAQSAANRLAHRKLPLRRVVNATGTVTHTNLGRSILPKAAGDALLTAARHCVNLEYSLQKGGRGDRNQSVEAALKRLTQAEAAVVVNNNAAAVLIALKALAEGRETIVSRGELIEIGGSFRLPDVMEAAGTTLREVGTTNRTHPRDYENAVNENTALLLKAHPSNYAVLGFTRETSIEQLAQIGRKRGLPVMEDLGSGALIRLEQYGLPAEPVASDRLAAGADIVTFSGDKLLGGPQAGILVGKEALIQRIKRHPLMRAVRVGKLTLASLAAVLEIYETSARPELELPMLRQMTQPLRKVKRRARRFVQRCVQELDGVAEAAVMPSEAQIGSGAQPASPIQSAAATLRPVDPRASVERWEARLRSADPPVVARIQSGRIWLDFRTIRPSDESDLLRAVRLLKTAP